MNYKSIKRLKHKRLLLFSSTLLLFAMKAQSQGIRNLSSELEVQATGTTNSTVPFWMRSNQNGSIPLSGASGSFLARMRKGYDTLSTADINAGRKKNFDWGFGFEGRANGGKDPNLLLIQAYAKVKASVFQLKVGRERDLMGFNGDTTLSSGNFAMSGNALGIPKVEISIPEYLSIPVFDGLFAFKGNFAHGWAGKVYILESVGSVDGGTSFPINNRNPKTYLHQKSLYVRLGKKDWRLKLYGGFNHQVFWGNEKEAYGPNFKLSSLESLWYVMLGKSYGTRGVPTSKIGNQLGSIDLGAEYNFDDIKLTVYRQSFYDVGALSKLANIADGLNGVSIENRHFDSNNRGFRWKKALFEVFYSKDQAGYPWSTPTKSGDEDYYNNFYYLEGWSYKDLGLGNPFITARNQARDGQAYRFADYFINNRVIALHLGLSGSLNQWNFNTKVSYSWNYGTFGTSKYGGSTGPIRNPQTTNLFVPVQQFSVFLEGMKQFDNGYSFGAATALDQGKLLNNSFGLQLRAVKSF